MKESDFEDCLQSHASLKITPDSQKSKSLIETADERIKYISKDIHDGNANFIFEDYYSSILEYLHSLALNDGYKISNHVCLGFYLKDFLKRSDLFILFDDLRYKRNSLVYYGKRMEYNVAIDAIEKSKKLIKDLKELLKFN